MAKSEQERISEKVSEVLYDYRLDFFSITYMLGLYAQDLMAYRDSAIHLPINSSLDLREACDMGDIKLLAGKHGLSGVVTIFRAASQEPRNEQVSQAINIVKSYTPKTQLYGLYLATAEEQPKIHQAISDKVIVQGDFSPEALTDLAYRAALCSDIQRKLISVFLPEDQARQQFILGRSPRAFSTKLT